jgi:hypothetical protein
VVNRTFYPFWVTSGRAVNCRKREDCRPSLAHLKHSLSTFGTLQLADLWAPCALRGIDREQTLGAVTVNGSLHLTHTSPEPIPGLLTGIEEVLRKACTS